MSDKSISNSVSAPAAKYKVGRGKPPVHAQFKPGVSGNPKGRPRKKDGDSVKEPGPRKQRKKKEKPRIEPPHRELTLQEISDAAANLSLDELRRRWAKAWGLNPHKHIGRRMLEKSLVFRLKELNGLGLTRLQQEKLDQLVKTYKRNPRCFDDKIGLKDGVRLVRKWKGERVDVLVRSDGFEYKGTVYSSLSAVARAVTGGSWNGWQFFGMKQKKKRW